ncbi:MAG: hypothetical protein COA99_15020 [Moraxellaceae bacterium]|nr:MAG: hypothetical protein COA99_15020 [Moraxellaceae bacterium]
MIYVVSYLDSRGEPASIKVEAGNKEEARWSSKIPERRITAVREDIVGRLAAAVEFSAPDAKNQAVFMQTLSSALASGRTVHQGIGTLLENSKWLKPKQEKLEACESLSDYLTLLHFDKFSILMARAAEKNGRYAESLRESSKYLLNREKISTDIGSELRLGITYILLGVAFFIIIPMFLGETIEGMMSGAMKLKPNGFTLVLLGLGDVFRNYGFLVIVLVPFLIFYRKVCWRLIKGLPFFSLFHQKRLLDRGTQFLSVYRMLRKSGFVDTDIIYELLESSRGEARDIYGRIYAHLASSEDLSSAFDEEDWDPTIRDGMLVISSVDDNEQARILEAMEATLQLQNIHAARAVSKALSRLGFFLMVASVLAAVLGFYLPLAGAASGGGF